MASVTYTFTNGTTADADEINQNYTDLVNEFNATSGHDHDGTDSKTVTTLGTVSAGTWQGTAVATGYGGTGQDFSATAQGNIIYFSAAGTVAALGPGTSGQFLKTQGASANPVWANMGASNVVFTWSGIEGYASGDAGGYLGTSLTAAAASDIDGYFYFLSDIETYTTFLNFKFKKIASISTVTIQARLWTDGNITATLNVDIGGASNTVIRTNNATPAWVTASDIDVSGLTNGTVYDGIVQLKSSNASDEAYCGAVTLIAS